MRAAEFGPQPFTAWVHQPAYDVVQMWWLHHDRAVYAGAIASYVDSPHTREMLSEQCLHRGRR